MGCLVYCLFVSALPTDTQNSESVSVPAVYHQDHVFVTRRTSLHTVASHRVDDQELLGERIGRGPAYRPRNSDRIPCNAN